VVDALSAGGYPIAEEYFVDALPVGVALETFRQRPARVTQLIDEGDVIDLGDRRLPRPARLRLRRAREWSNRQVEGQQV